MPSTRARLAVLASGGGSNLQAIHDDLLRRGNAASAELALVISDRSAAGALERARTWGVNALHLPKARDAELAAMLAEAGITHIALDTEDKLPAYLRMRDALGLTDAQCAHMGDDVPDLPLMERVSLALTVADAHPKALAAAHWTSRYGGGQGAVREAVDLLLNAQGLA